MAITDKQWAKTVPPVRKCEKCGGKAFHLYERDGKLVCGVCYVEPLVEGCEKCGRTMLIFHERGGGKLLCSICNVAAIPLRVCLRGLAEGPLPMIGGKMRREDFDDDYGYYVHYEEEHPAFMCNAPEDDDWDSMPAEKDEYGEEEGE